MDWAIPWQSRSFIASEILVLREGHLRQCQVGIIGYVWVCLHYSKFSFLRTSLVTCGSFQFGYVTSGYFTLRFVLFQKLLRSGLLLNGVKLKIVFFVLYGMQLISSPEGRRQIGRV